LRQVEQVEMEPISFTHFLVKTDQQLHLLHLIRHLEFLSLLTKNIMSLVVGLVLNQ
jgi:hypothetical protein